MKQLGVSSLFIFGSISYASYKFHESQKLLDTYNEASDKKKFLYDVHNKLAYTFNEKFEDKQEYVMKIQDYRQLLLQNASGNILETCVGQSRNIRFYSQNSKVTGIDWAPNMIEMSLIKDNKDKKINYNIEDLEFLSFPDNTFDTIVDTFGLEYTNDPDKCIAEMKRVCKKDGTILLMNKGKSLYSFQNIWDEYNYPHFLHQFGYFNNRNWEDIIENHAFEILKQERKQNGQIYIQILKNIK